MGSGRLVRARRCGDPGLRCRSSHWAETSHAGTVPDAVAALASTVPPNVFVRPLRGGAPEGNCRRHTPILGQEQRRREQAWSGSIGVLADMTPTTRLWRAPTFGDKAFRRGPRRDANNFTNSTQMDHRADPNELRLTLLPRPSCLGLPGQRRLAGFSSLSRCEGAGRVCWWRADGSRAV